ncbi:MAG TPA: protein kinase [Rubrobacteraceae bacterium]|nr:protein kinase [Rubrobacteraceae bacterium]
MLRIVLDERYVRLCRLGGGGMGEVHLVRDELLDREVALKVPRGPQARSVEFVERFRREARHVAALSHPNIVRVFDAGEAPDGTPYMAMEYVPGGTLRDRLLEKGSLPARTAASVALQISAALRAAHTSGVIHRDVKPENVLVSENGDVKVADFGIARATDATVMTHTSRVLGTVRYLSPEQAMGEPVGPASDLYSLGVVLYEMLTGEVPFEAEGPLAVAMRHLTQEPRPLRELDPSVPVPLEAITLKLLEKRPEERYGSAEALAEDLERFLAGDVASSTAEMSGIPPAVDEKRSPRRARRRRSRVLVAALLTVSLAVLGVSIGAAAGFAEPVTRHPFVAGILAFDEEQEPLGRALAPSTPGTEELEAPEREDEAPREAVPPKERPEVAKTPPSSPQQAMAARWRPAAPEQPVSPSQGTEQPAPATVVVPALAGMAVEDAQAILGEVGLGLAVGSYEQSETVPQGIVLSQGPAAGYRAEPGAIVSVTVSSGPPEAPQRVRGSEPSLADEVIAGIDMEPAKLPEMEVPEVEMPEVGQVVSEKKRR